MTRAFDIRLATAADQPGIARLMDLAIRELQKPFLTEREIRASAPDPRSACEPPS